MTTTKKQFFSAFLVLSVYLALSLTNPFQQHILQNLEPYPDGLLYVVPAHSLAAGGKFALVNEGTTLRSWTPPLYSLLLVGGYLINQHPEMFYVVNMLLGLTTLAIITWFIAKKTGNWYGVLLVGALYILHPIVIWLHIVPMTENLNLLLIAVLIVLLDEWEFSSKKIVALVMLSLAMLLTRLSNVSVVVTALGLSALFYNTGHDKKIKWQGIVLFLGLIGTVVAIMLWLNPRSLFFFTQFFDLNSQNTYYGIKYFFPNLLVYMKSLIGQNQPFLWLSIPLSGLGVSFFALATLLYAFLTKQKSDVRKTLRVLFLIALGSTIVPLFFYVADTRYIVTLIPLFCIGIVVFIDMLQKQIESKQVKLCFVMLIVCAVLVQMLTQSVLLKKIILMNWFGRTRGWQAESILSIDAYFSSNRQGYLITALPPYLYRLYAVNHVSLLPLSSQQEFISKDYWVWGSETNLSDWKRDLPQLLSQSPLYISNAYITHSAEVVADYEAHKEIFNFELVSEGCLQACNIYKLSLKSSESTPSSSPTPPSVPPEVPSPATP